MRKRAAVASFLLLSMCFCVAVASAQSESTNASSNPVDWSSSSTWSGGIVPNGSTFDIQILNTPAGVFLDEQNATVNTLLLGGPLNPFLELENGHSLTVDGSFDITDGGSLSTDGGTLIVNGSLTIGPGAFFKLVRSGDEAFPGGILNVSGNITNEAGASLSTLRAGVMPIGIGVMSIAGALNNLGTVSDLGGKLNLGSYRQFASGTLNELIKTSSDFGVIDVQGAVSLNGTLDLSMRFDPVVGTTLDIMNFALNRSPFLSQRKLEFLDG